jgi:hypothetical protein
MLLIETLLAMTQSGVFVIEEQDIIYIYCNYKCGTNQIKIVADVSVALMEYNSQDYIQKKK